MCSVEDISEEDAASIFRDRKSMRLRNIIITAHIHTVQLSKSGINI
jgi:hypothetical protein